MEKDKPTQLNVTSINQSGGITAHTVHVTLGPPQRSLSGPWGESVKADLLNKLPRDKKIRIHASASDQEALRFAEEILTFVRQHQYDLWANCVLQSLAGPAPTGLVLNAQGSRCDLIVGTSA